MKKLFILFLVTNFCYLSSNALSLTQIVQDILNNENKKELLVIAKDGDLFFITEILSNRSTTFKINKDSQEVQELRPHLPETTSDNTKNIFLELLKPGTTGRITIHSNDALSKAKRESIAIIANERSKNKTQKTLRLPSDVLKVAYTKKHLNLENIKKANIANKKTHKELPKSTFKKTSL